jgi:hypothetical protein
MFLILSQNYLADFLNKSCLLQKQQVNEKHSFLIIKPVMNSICLVTLLGKSSVLKTKNLRYPFSSYSMDSNKAKAQKRKNILQ